MTPLSRVQNINIQNLSEILTLERFSAGQNTPKIISIDLI